MTFSVHWSQVAFESISEIIETTANLDQIVAAIRELDESLTHDPATKGESRPEGRRIIFAPPLAALFEVHWRMNEVVIGRIWRFEKHNSL